MYNAILNGTPCVVLEGSGRIADVIAQVAGLPVSQVTIKLIHQLMKKFFGQEYETFQDDTIIKWTKTVCEDTGDPDIYRIFFVFCSCLLCCNSFISVSFVCQIQDIIRMSHLLTIFRVGPDNQGDVDVAILQALLKGRDFIQMFGL